MWYRNVLIFLAIISLPACRIDISVPAAGRVITESGAYSCNSLSDCTVEVPDTGFNETFVAMPADGFQFIGWKRGYTRLCGGSLAPCTIETSWFSAYENMMALLASDSVAYLEPEFIPSDHIRSYQAGDIAVYSGTVSLWARNEPLRTTSVAVRQEYLPGTFAYLDKTVLTQRTTVTFADTGATHVSQRNIWQEENGELFELTDDDGNEYVTASAFEKGLLSIPVPLVAFSSTLADFYTMYGGPVTGPVTEGVRSIEVARPEEVVVPMGAYKAYPLSQRESYEYLHTYVDHKSGSSVAITRNLWVSPAKGVVKKVETRREYFSSGVLQAEVRWELEAKRVNF